MQLEMSPAALRRFQQELGIDQRWLYRPLIASHIATEPHRLRAPWPGIAYTAYHVSCLRHLTVTPPDRTPRCYRPVLSHLVRMISGDENRRRHALVPRTGRSLSAPKLHQDLYGKACRISICLDGSLYNPTNSTRQLDMVHKMKLPLAFV
jgi:hypothetical protein